MVTIDDDTESPMELTVADDGRVFYVERITGELNVYNPVNGQVTTAITIPVSSVQENGLMGIQLAPNFNTNDHLYVAYTPPPNTNNQTRISRFTVGANNTIDPASEQFIFQWTAQRSECCHSGGSLAFAPERRPLHLHRRQHQPVRVRRLHADRRAPRPRVLGRPAHLGQLQQPQRQGPAHPPAAGRDRRAGHRHDLLDPDGNMFAPGTPQTLPEIYAMGFRNPFRITVDPNTGWVLVGNYGPDASATNPNRGPQGSVEFEVVKGPGFYGWPYCVRDNVPYNDYNFANSTSGRSSTART